MRTTLQRILLVLAAAAVVSQLVFMVASRGLRRFSVHQRDRFTEIFEGKARHDLLFIGSSRAHSDVKPQVIDRLLRIDSFNAGIEGGSAAEFVTVLEGYLVHHPPPAAVVLMVDVGTLDLTRRLWNPLLYYPYLDNAAVDRGLRGAGFHPLLLRALPFIEAIDYDDYTRGNCLKGLLGKTEIGPGMSQYKGYMDQGRGGMAAPHFLPTSTMTVSPDGLATLQSFVDLCRSRGITLVMLVPPMFPGLLKQWTNSEAVLESLSSLARRNGLALTRHDGLPLASRQALFADPGHLNDAGAEAYSAVLADELARLDRFRRRDAPPLSVRQ